MTRYLRHAGAMLALVAVWASDVPAAGVLDHVPGEALGVVVVRQLRTADAKLRQLEEIFAGSRAWTKPLDLLRTIGGGDAGIDVEGDALLALLAGAAPGGAPKPLLLVAVADYAKLAAATGGDSTGELAPVRIAGQDVLMARRGDFALLMNVEDRSAMEALLNEAIQPATELAELGSWIETQNGAIVVLPAGIRVLETVAAKDDFGQGAPKPVAMAEAGSLLTGLEAAFGLDVRALAIGGRLDQDATLRLSARALTKQELVLPKSLADQAPPAAALAGMPEEPFVFAAAGPLPHEWVEPAVQLARRSNESLAEQSGYEDFDEPQWKKLEESWRLVLSTTAIKLRLLAGDKGDPLISNISAVVTVEDAEAYIADARRAHELSNALTQLSSSDLKLVYEFSDVTIAGLKGLMISSDVAKAAGDEYPLFKALWDTTFGPGGVFHNYLIPVDENTVILAYGSDQEAAAAVKNWRASEPGLANSAHVRTTADLVEPGAPWTVFVSSQGCIAWFGRLYALLYGQFGAPPLELGDLPAGPPLALTFNVADNQLQADAVAPAQALRDLAAIRKSWPKAPLTARPNARQRPAFVLSATRASARSSR